MEGIKHLRLAEEEGHQIPERHVLRLQKSNHQFQLFPIGIRHWFLIEINLELLDVKSVRLPFFFRTDDRFSQNKNYHGHEQIEEEGFPREIARCVRKIGEVAQEVRHRVGRLLSPHDSGDFFRHPLQQTVEHGTRQSTAGRITRLVDTCSRL